MELYFAIWLFALSTTITPGPNNIMIMASGVNFGIRRSIPHLLGVCFGFPPMVISLGLGFNHVLSMYPIIHESIKVIGVLYLLYLAWLIANSSPSSLDSDIAKPISFIKAALFQWLNPKAWVMAIGAISAYTSITSNIFMQILYIALVFFIVAFPCLCVWLFFGTTLKKYLTNIKHQKMFNKVMASILVLSVVPAIHAVVNEIVA
jgi:threonine/homoserine/homoserine lactone efflux protein